MRRWFGVHVRRMPDARGKMYLSFVVWYPRRHNRLGYFYPSLRWL